MGTDWPSAALKYAETVGLIEYKVNGKFLEYWTFCGRSEGFIFVRYDLELGKEVFRGARIPWDNEAGVPMFLLTATGAASYNYMTG